MALHGKFLISLDDKGRVAMPTAFRAALGEGSVWVTESLYDPCLWLLPQFKWETIVERFKTIPMDETGRHARRRVLASASELSMDGNGRLQLPASLRTDAKLDKQVVMLGVGDMLELWSSSVLSAVNAPLTSAQLTPELMQLGQ
jgi:MraZ protein